MQRFPQIVAKGTPLLPELEIPKEVGTSSFIARGFIKGRQSSCASVYEWCYNSLSFLSRWPLQSVNHEGTQSWVNKHPGDSESAPRTIY